MFNLELIELIAFLLCSLTIFPKQLLFPILKKWQVYNIMTILFYFLWLVHLKIGITLRAWGQQNFSVQSWWGLSWYMNTSKRLNPGLSQQSIDFPQDRKTNKQQFKQRIQEDGSKYQKKCVEVQGVMMRLSMGLLFFTINLVIYFSFLAINVFFDRNKTHKPIIFKSKKKLTLFTQLPMLETRVLSVLPHFLHLVNYQVLFIPSN